jgi:hypothetical protein
MKKSTDVLKRAEDLGVIYSPSLFDKHDLSGMTIGGSLYKGPKEGSMRLARDVGSPNVVRSPFDASVEGNPEFTIGNSLFKGGEKDVDARKRKTAGDRHE